MTNHAGWEHLFQSGDFPPRYQQLAAPNESVSAWADTLPIGAYVLDLGCGVGRHTVYLGMCGFRMAGLDLSPTGVAQTQAACAARQIPFDGHTGDMTRLPWGDDTFDAVLSTSTVCHHRMADIQKTLAEVWRVLKPGGLFLVDFLHKGTLSYREVLDQAAAGTLTEIEPNTFVDESADRDLRDDAFIPHHFCDESEVRDLLRTFELLKVWTDIPPDLTSLPRRGYWIASARKWVE